MFCTKCGHNNRENAKFCAACGKPAAAPAVVPTTTPPEIPSPVQTHDQPIATPPQPAPAAPEATTPAARTESTVQESTPPHTFTEHAQTSKPEGTAAAHAKGKWIALLVGIVALACAAGGGGWYYFKHVRSAPDTPAASQDTAAEAGTPAAAPMPTPAPAPMPMQAPAPAPMPVPATQQQTPPVQVAPIIPAPAKPIMLPEPEARQWVARLQREPNPASCRAGEQKIRKEANVPASQASDIAKRAYPELCTPAPTKPAAMEPTAPSRTEARTIDQMYKERSKAECERGFLGLICRESLKIKLCSDKWSEEPPPGQSLCQQTRNDNN